MKPVNTKNLFMRNPALLILMILLVIIVACNNNESSLNMVGAYAMTNQVINSGGKDSVLDRKQLKIYTDKYMMYASPNVQDSFANFGIGTYETKNGKVTENIFYTSENGNVNTTAVLNIDKRSDGGYRQVIDRLMIDGKPYKLTEDYDAAGTNQKSPLDGAWKQTRNIYYRSNKDSSVNSKPLEYKTYQSGYFIWAITVSDSANKKTSVFGYGRFEMDGQNKIKETVQNSTFITGLVGKTYSVDIEMMGNNGYKQTITFANGEKSTEVYERLK
jgi:hypothetical protein